MRQNKLIRAGLLSRKRLCLLLWLSLSGLPFVVVPEYRKVLLIVTNFGQRIDVAVALAAQPLVMLAEGLALCLLPGAAKSALLRARSPLNRWVLRTGLALSCSLSALYVLAIATSWYFFQVQGVFIGAPEIRAMLGTAGPRKILLFAMQSGDRFMVLGSATLFLLVTVLFAMLSPVFETGRQLRSYIKDIVVLLGIAFAVLLSIRFSVGQEAYAGLGPHLRSVVSPQFSLWVEPLVPQNSGPGYTDVELSLEPAITLDEYRARAAELKPQKNVIIIFIEAFRADLLFMEVDGKKITPFLNGLAERAANFPVAYANDAETSYSVATILSGQHPLKYPYKDLYVTSSPRRAQIYDVLKQFGYSTAYFTDEWETTARATGSPSLDLTIDRVRSGDSELKKLLPEKYQPLLSAPPELAHIRDLLYLEAFKSWQASAPKPFFAAFYLSATHFPYQWFPEMGEPLLESGPLDQEPQFFSYPENLAPVLKKRYLNLAHYMDQVLEKFFVYLQTEGLLDQSVIVITGDHGEAFHEHGRVTHGGSLFEEVVRVPLIIWNSGHTCRSCSADSPVSHIDIAPTVLELLELPPFGAFQGQVLLRKDSCSCKNAPVVMSNQIAVYEDALRKGPWKYIKRYRSGAHLLYNLRQDPGELEDRSAQETQVAADMERTLKRFRDTQFSFFLGPAERQRRFFPPPIRDQSGD